MSMMSQNVTIGAKREPKAYWLLTRLNGWHECQRVTGTQNGVLSLLGSDECVIEDAHQS